MASQYRALALVLCCYLHILISLIADEAKRNELHDNEQYHKQSASDPYDSIGLALQATLKIHGCHGDRVLCRKDAIRIGTEKSVDLLVNQVCWNICTRPEDLAQKWMGYAKVSDSSIGMHFGKFLSRLWMGDNNMSFLLPRLLQLRRVFKTQYFDLSIGSFKGIF